MRQGSSVLGLSDSQLVVYLWRTRKAKPPHKSKGELAFRCWLDIWCRTRRTAIRLPWRTGCISWKHWFRSFHHLSSLPVWMPHNFPCLNPQYLVHYPHLPLNHTFPSGDPPSLHGYLLTNSSIHFTTHPTRNGSRRESPNTAAHAAIFSQSSFPQGSPGFEYHQEEPARASLSALYLYFDHEGYTRWQGDIGTSSSRTSARKPHANKIRHKKGFLGTYVG